MAIAATKYEKEGILFLLLPPSSFTHVISPRLKSVCGIHTLPTADVPVLKDLDRLIRRCRGALLLHLYRHSLPALTHCSFPSSGITFPLLLFRRKFHFLLCEQKLTPFPPPPPPSPNSTEKKGVYFPVCTHSPFPDQDAHFSLNNFFKG